MRTLSEGLIRATQTPVSLNFVDLDSPHPQMEFQILSQLGIRLRPQRRCG